MSCRASAGRLGRALEQRRPSENQSETDHGDGSGPGNEIESKSVDVFAHEVAAIDEQQDKNNNDREPDAVAHLREDQDFPQRCVWKKDDAAADDDQQGVEAVKD